MAKGKTRSLPARGFAKGEPWVHVGVRFAGLQSENAGFNFAKHRALRSNPALANISEQVIRCKCTTGMRVRMERVC